MSAFSQMNDKLSEQLRLLLEEPPSPAAAPGPHQLVRAGYRACMDQERIEGLGAGPLVATLTSLGVWPGPLQSRTWEPAAGLRWWDVMYTLRRLGLSSDLLINFSVATDLRNSSRHIMSLDQPELGLAREFLVRGEQDPVVAGYSHFMVAVFTMLGVEPALAADTAATLLQFEMKLANITMPRELRRDPNHQYNPMPISGLSSLDPDTPWLDYLATILGPDNGGAQLTEEDVVVVGNPEYVARLRALLGETPLRVQVSYIIWRISAATLSYLHEEAEDIAFQFASALSGQRQVLFIFIRSPCWIVTICSPAAAPVAEVCGRGEPGPESAGGLALRPEILLRGGQVRGGGDGGGDQEHLPPHAGQRGLDGRGHQGQGQGQGPRHGRIYRLSEGVVGHG